MRIASPIWRMLLAHCVCRADSRACAKTGSRIPARIAMIAITTSSSISVNPRGERWAAPTAWVPARCAGTRVGR